METKLESNKVPRQIVFVMLLIALTGMALAVPVFAFAAESGLTSSRSTDAGSASGEWPEFDATVDAIVNSIASLPMLRDGNIRLGRNLELSHAQADKDLVAIGQQVDIKNITARGNLLMVGLDVALESSSTEQNILALGRSMTMSDMSAGSVVAVGSTVSVDGTCKDLAIYADTAYIDGVVNGDVAVGADRVEIGSKAQITGTLYVCGSNDPVLRKGAQVAHVESVQFTDDSLLSGNGDATGSKNEPVSETNVDIVEFVNDLDAHDLAQHEKLVNSARPSAGAEPVQTAGGSRAFAYVGVARPAVSSRSSDFADHVDHSLSLAADDADEAEEDTETIEEDVESAENTENSMVELASTILVFVAVMAIVGAVLSEFASALFMFMAVLGFLGVVVTALLVEWLFRRQTAGAAEMVRKRTVPTVVSGVVGTIVMIPLVILLVCLGVTLPVAGGVAFALLAMSSVATGFMGASLFRLVFKNIGRFKCALAGGAILGLVNAIPYLGVVVQIVAFMYLLGFILQSLYLSMQEQDAPSASERPAAAHADAVVSDAAAEQHDSVSSGGAAEHMGGNDPAFAQADAPSSSTAEISGANDLLESDVGTATDDPVESGQRVASDDPADQPGQRLSSESSDLVERDADA